MSRRFVFAVLAVVLLGIVFRGPLVAYGKSALLISEVFPAIGVKPLAAVTEAPRYSEVTFASERGSVVADLFLPVPRFGTTGLKSAPSLILCLGVRVQQLDRPVLLNLAQALARLGFVVIWPRSESLNRGVPSIEEPATFLAGYRYLEGLEIVDPTRISFVGFSVGSSIAFITAADDDIADRVRSVVFFGGYFDIFDYVTSLVTRTASCGDRVIPWQASPAAVEHMKEIFEEKRSPSLMRVFDATSREEADAILRAAPQADIADLRKLDPRERVDRFRSRIFILHDEGDSLIPYCDAVTLKESLPPRVESTYLLLHVFEHVTPTKAISPETLADFARLYQFLAAVLEYM